MVVAYTKSLFESVKKSRSSLEPVGSSFFATAPVSLSVIPSKAQVGEDRWLTSLYVVAEELELLESTLLYCKDLRNALMDPSKSEEKKLAVLLIIFPGFTKPIYALVKLLTERKHLSYLSDIIDQYWVLLSKFENSIDVNLITASRLNMETGDPLLTSLKKITQANEIILTTYYNPALLGGFMVEYKSVLIDATVLNEFSFFFAEM
uniref:ATP synthase CF1 delta subunit n=1 Tax=Neotessella volvocina TaxID=52559 RepID=A0A3G2R055_9STRA|nr:ATP synthase CF1 delta subunit [Neotessella volvocina]